MKLRFRLLQDGQGPLPAACQLPEGYALDVFSDHDECVHCGGQLYRARTSIQHPIGLMWGHPRVRLIQRQCVACGRVDSWDGYQQHVPPQGQYAFDLMVEVGLARLRDQRQDTEIQRLLQQRWGLSIPASSVGWLVHAFLDGLAAVHQAHAPTLRQFLAENGGYALHVDGTCEPATDVVFTALAEPHGWTLEAAKMSTENIADIRQVMQRCVEHFGTPHAVVRDLSSNIRQAKQQALPDVPDLICHYHFLENVGEKLCEQPHARLTQALRRLKIRPALKSLRCDLVRSSHKATCLSRSDIELLLSHPDRLADFDPVALRRTVGYILLRWLDDFTADLRGEYFPFDLPSLAFYRRGQQLADLVSQLVATPNFPRKEWPTLHTIAHHLAVFREDAELGASAQRLEKAADLFEELRQVLRLNSHPQERVLRGHGCLEEDHNPTGAEQLQKRMETWRDHLRQRNQHERDPHRRADQATVLKYLEKYGQQLVGHVIERPGREPFVVCRTNNPVEQRFSFTKRGVRRKVGTKKLTRQVQAMRAEALLVWNLADPQYVQLVLGGSLANLPSEMAKHWHLAQAMRQQRQAPATQHPIPTTKKQIRHPKLLDTIKQLAKNLIDAILRKPRAA